MDSKSFSNCASVSSKLSKLALDADDLDETHHDQESFTSPDDKRVRAFTLFFLTGRRVP